LKFYIILEETYNLLLTYISILKILIYIILINQNKKKKKKLNNKAIYRNNLFFFYLKKKKKIIHAFNINIRKKFRQFFLFIIIICIKDNI